MRIRKTGKADSAKPDQTGFGSTLFITSSSIYKLFKYQRHIAEFANNVDLDEVAHYEPPHLDLHCLPSYHLILNMI